MIGDPATHRRGAPLQPLLHAADRRAAQDLSRQPLLFGGNARAVRDRPRRRRHRQRHRPRARPRRRLFEPRAAQFREARTDHPQDLRQGRAPEPPRADRARPEGFRARSRSARSTTSPPCSANSSGDEQAQADRGHADDRDLARRRSRPQAAKPDYILREPRHGDFGWIVSRHAELYAQEYGWTEPFEGLCAQIVADFVNNYDAKRERCWIAEMNGENVGCVMLVKDSDEVARIRLLLVDPKARGLGLGTAADRRMRDASRARPATRRSRCGPTAFSPPRATSTRRPASR